jgi:hypothetical protein
VIGGGNNGVGLDRATPSAGTLPMNLRRVMLLMIETSVPFRSRGTCCWDR